MMQMARPHSPRHTYRMMRPMTMPLAVSAMSPAIFSEMFEVGDAVGDDDDGYGVGGGDRRHCSGDDGYDVGGGATGGTTASAASSPSDSTRLYIRASRKAPSKYLTLEPEPFPPSVVSEYVALFG